MNAPRLPRGRMHPPRRGGPGAAPAPRRLTPTTGALALRGLLAAVVVAAALAAVVAYGNGAFSSDPEVTARVPAEAGLLTGSVGVRYQGVPVGEVSGVDSGTGASTVHMRIDADALGRIPADVQVRVAPRTLFGDVVLELVPAAGADAAGPAPASGPLRPGAELRTDTSPEAVVLYDVYRRSMELVDRLEPQRMQTALTAAASALSGRGAVLGRSLDRLAGAAGVLTPVAHRLLGHAPQLAEAAEAAQRATGDLLGLGDDLTALSGVVLDRPGALARLFSAAGATAGTVQALAAEDAAPLTRAVTRSAPAMAAVSADPGAVADSLDALRAFAGKGAAAFSTGRFGITAVPSFADPMPYTPADCPRYGALAGCAGGGR